MRILVVLLAVATLSLSAVFFAEFAFPRNPWSGIRTSSLQGPPNATPQAFREANEAVTLGRELPAGWTMQDHGAVEYEDGSITVRAPSSELASATVYVCGLPVKTATRANGGIVDAADVSIATLPACSHFSWWRRVEWVAEDGRAQGQETRPWSRGVSFVSPK